MDKKHKGKGLCNDIIYNSNNYSDANDIVNAFGSYFEGLYSEQPNADYDTELEIKLNSIIQKYKTRETIQTKYELTQSQYMFLYLRILTETKLLYMTVLKK